ncbi:2OG-Fe(II) oxygenase [Pseudenhygromyxa sp. WMMC2535]|uniref:2OG-Fe(II) oxygenase n=1 Tax=Pseudenhygromyxa sp. WMMC2535 TaxID=2712867 RepID=UPI0015538896|nr:2OG-Fe(II) oxygenase [Pseudenhygromyxa sp. WMMC2535]NVB36542.1 2OG-Fe(II) oxygenase [Pseudenhygromyxa sp. WMMC2535]
MNGLHAERSEALDPATCRAICAALKRSPLVGDNALSPAFTGSSGVQAVFTREGLNRLHDELGMLAPAFACATSPESNAFFINALIIHDAARVEAHLDCSLDTHLGVHTVPRRVCVVYVQVPEDLEGGALEILEPDGHLHRVHPQIGLLVQFRGDLVHGITAARTSSTRISVVIEEYVLEPPLLGLVPRFAIGPTPRRGEGAGAKLAALLGSLSASEREALRGLGPDELSRLCAGLEE